MPIYAFYPTRADGASLSFDMREFDDDAEALRFGQSVFREHQSCDYVVVWSDDQVIGHVPQGAALAVPDRRRLMEPREVQL